MPPRRLNASIPRDLETICLKCLEKEPGKRYASARGAGGGPGSVPGGRADPGAAGDAIRAGGKWARRRPAIAALLGLVALVTALGLGGVLWQWRAAARACPPETRSGQSRRAEAQTDWPSNVCETAEGQAKEKKQTELAEQRLYDVRMNLVQRYWEDYNGELLQQGLDEQLPANQGGIDRRGFEWFYWQRKMSSGHITLKGHTGGVTSVAFSPDGKRLASARLGWDGEGVGRRDRPGNPHSQGAYRA